MDCEDERRRGLRRIKDHTTSELNTAVEKAHRHFGDDFWLMLHGIDAYMERRRRRIGVRARQLLSLNNIDDIGDEWGHS
jgi:hypothetical protein